MQDDTLAELLRSPLDDPEPPWRPPRWVATLLASSLLGALLGLAWLASRPPGQEMVVVAATTTATPPDQPGAPFPAGYVQVGADVALRPLAVYDQGTTIVVVVNAVAAAGKPPGDSRAFPGGVWQLRDVEGRVLEDYEEIRNPQALGTLAVRFFNEQASRPRTLVLTPLGEPEVISASIPVELSRFPLTTGASLEVPLASGLRLTGVILQLGEEGGDVRWSLAGAEALAQVDLVVTLPETAGDDGVATTMMSEHIAPPYPFQRQRLPRPAPLASGEDVLRRAGPEIADPATVTRAVLDVTVHLYRTQHDATVEFDIEPLR